VPSRTLQHRLKTLTDSGRLVREGERRWAKYRLPGNARAVTVGTDDDTLAAQGELGIPLSEGGKEVKNYVRQPMEKRKPVGYNRTFLESYRPNVTNYLTNNEQAHLFKTGTVEGGDRPAGTYARQILNRLLIDLSWNSSRLEGNTYSLLDTKRLVDFGEEAEGKDRLEAQMILNHKDAIEFLVGSAEEIGFNRYTILNLHAMLANNLLADEGAAGRLRRMAVGIEKSAFHSLETPQLIEESFDQLLATAAAIENPFEQSFFAMVHLPYLQPFDDVNKRVSRLAANITMIKRNLCPLSFTDVPRRTYTDAVLGVYELNRVDLLKDVFIWAYERSAARYAAVRQSIGEPDPFRLRHRAALRDLIGQVIHERVDRKTAAGFIASWTEKRIEQADRERFRELAERELLGLHEGNFARYRVRPSEFAAWQKAWDAARARG
jgi:Fic family protein